MNFRQFLFCLLVMNSLWIVPGVSLTIVAALGFLVGS